MTEYVFGPAIQGVKLIVDLCIKKLVGGEKIL